MLNDYDKDGCHDTAEDDDWDNDGVSNTHDNCPRGALGWFSTTLNDWDQDGCRDSTEDPDDDNDGFLDWEDSCERSPIIEGYDWRTNFDNDNDGCEDTTEDTDLDNDGVESQYDNCENEPDSNWVSAPEVDFDGDGCADSVDTDDDDDGVSDDVDGCPLTESVSSDFDRDGCDDSTEDLDDDGDGVEDSTDKCPLGLINWDSSSGSDIDADGCMDSLEDDHVDGQLLYILRNNALMTMISITMLVLLLAGLVASNGKRRSGIRIRDHTWEVERMMQTPSISLENPIEETQRQVRDLTDFGYSPEVAEAIVMHEERARRYQ